MTREKERSVIPMSKVEINAKFRVLAPGCEHFAELPGYPEWTIARRATHTLSLIEGRTVRAVRELEPGQYRGLVGRRISATIEVQS